MTAKHISSALMLCALFTISLSAQNGVGVNTDSIVGQIHVTTDSHTGFPHLRLTEEGDDYARIKFENTQYPDSHWDIAGLTGTDTTGAPYLNFYFYNGTAAKNLVLIRGNGDFWRNSFRDDIYDHYWGDDVYRGGFGFDSTDFRLFTGSGANGKIRIGTKGRNNLIVDAVGNVGIGASPDTVQGELHVTTTSNSGFPHLRLTQEGADYARIKFENTQYPDSHWDIEGRSGTDTTGDPFLNFNFNNGTTVKNLVLIKGNGDFRRNSFRDDIYDHYWGDDVYRGGFGFDSTDFRLFTGSGANGKIRIGTKGRNNLIVDAVGNVGIGSSPDTVQGELHVTTNSGSGFPHLRLTEEGDDYARIKFESTQYPDSHWDIEARSGTDTTGDPFLNFNFNNGTVAKNLVLIKGNGDFRRNSFRDDIYDHYWADNVYRGGFGFELEDMRFFTGSQSDGKFRIGTRGTDDIVIDTLGNVGIGTLSPTAQLHVNGNLTVTAGNRIWFGDTEYIQDGGTNATKLRSDLVPTNDNFFNLGSAALRWQDVWATNGTINTSDRRDKTSINDIEYGLTTVLSLRPVSYKWRDMEEQGPKFGLIAQEVLDVIPEVVKTHDIVTTEDGGTEVLELNRMGLYYSDLIPVLIKAFQEQNALIQTLQSENAELVKNQAKIIEALENAGIGID